MLSLLAAGSGLVVPSRTGTITMADTSWRRSYDGKGGTSVAPPVNQKPSFSIPWGGAAAAGAPAAAAPAAAAPSGSMTVIQAMKFMNEAPGTVRNAHRTDALWSGRFHASHSGAFAH